MSIIPPESIQVIAQSFGTLSLSNDVAAGLASDVEYRMREIVQEAIKCMRHSKRATLTTDDVNTALSLRNVEPLYGFASSSPFHFRRALGHPDLFYIEDRELPVQDLLDSRLPKYPTETQIRPHWLAVEGVQPAIPENPPSDTLLPVLPEPKKKVEGQPGLPTKEDTPVELKLAVRHVLSKELQLYFEKIMDLVCNTAANGSTSTVLQEALRSLARDAGLHPLIPYFTQFIADEVTRSLENAPLLSSLLRVVASLTVNPHVHLEPYLHQLLPPILTCMVGKRIGGRQGDAHWGVRDQGAALAAFICARFGRAYESLQPRFTKTLILALLDPKKSLPQHYGAIKGLAALGSQVLRQLLLPNVRTYLELLRPEMSAERQKDIRRRHEAWRVYRALQVAIGSCILSSLKSQPDAAAQLPRVRQHLRDDPDLQRMAAKIGCLPLARAPAVDTSKRKVLRLVARAPVIGGEVPFDKGLPPRLPTELKRSAVRDTSQNTKRLKVEHQEGTKGGCGRLRSAAPVVMGSWKEDVETWALARSLLEEFGDEMIPFLPFSPLHITL